MDNGRRFHGLVRLTVGHLTLPLDLAQGVESFDSAQDRETCRRAQVVPPVERLVESFRISCFGSSTVSLQRHCQKSLTCAIEDPAIRLIAGSSILNNIVLRLMKAGLLI